MSAKKEIREYTQSLKLQIAIETLDIIEEKMANIGNLATKSGHELKFSETHDYLINEAKKQRDLIHKLNKQDCL